MDNGFLGPPSRETQKAIVSRFFENRKDYRVEMFWLYNGMRW